MTHKQFIIVSILVVLCTLLSSCSVPLEKARDEVKADDTGYYFKESAPEEQGMDGQLLGESDGFIRVNYPNVYSMLVIRNGFLVYEKYYNDKDKNTPTHVFSVTKSVMSALAGIALREKYIRDLDQKLEEFYPEYFPTADGPRKRTITIRDILTMTGGLESVDKDIMPWFRSPDWFKYVIDSSLVTDPGKEFVYNTGLTHLLSGIITKSAKMSTLEFADRYLFQPLDIKVERWDKDPQGYYGGGHLLYLKPRDMAKLGYLYLNNGQWDGKQVVPEEWVTESLKPHISFDRKSGYGYLWWLGTANINGIEYKFFNASGYGGQYIRVVPDFNLVTVITADPDKRSKNGEDTGKLIDEYVIPALK